MSDPLRDQLQAVGMTPLQYVHSIMRTKQRGALVSFAREHPTVFAEAMEEMFAAHEAFFGQEPPQTPPEAGGQSG